MCGCVFFCGGGGVLKVICEGGRKYLKNLHEYNLKKAKQLYAFF